MSGGAAGLEGGYRRLLACYPRRFRNEHGEELLAVLLASARDGQPRPGLFESADLVRNGLGMRLRPDVSPSARQGWSDALAVYSLAGPVLLLLSTVAMPLTVLIMTPHPLAALSQGWLGLCVALTIEAVIVALVMAGRRKAALAAIAPAIAIGWLGTFLLSGFVLAIGPSIWIGLSVYLLEAVALIASPGPQHGRRLVHWGHWTVLLGAVAVVQATFVMSLAGQGSRAALGIMVILVFALNRLGRALRLSRYYRLLLAAAFYPTFFLVGTWDLGGFELQLRLMNVVGADGLVAGMYVGTLLCAVVAMSTVLRPRRRRII